MSCLFVIVLLVIQNSSHRYRKLINLWAWVILQMSGCWLLDPDWTLIDLKDLILSFYTSWISIDHVIKQILYMAGVLQGIDQFNHIYHTQGKVKFLISCKQFWKLHDCHFTLLWSSTNFWTLLHLLNLIRKFLFQNHLCTTYK